MLDQLAEEKALHEHEKREQQMQDEMAGEVLHSARLSDAARQMMSEQERIEWERIQEDRREQAQRVCVVCCCHYHHIVLPF